ncbi:MAG: alpha/beta fold hydrolase, partial [Elainellaceae cyanobacterium]
LAGAIALMNDYIETCSQPLHLVGHSTGGLLGLLYARQFPHRVKSLTLLSVGVYPAIDWKACYYAALKQLPCSRTRVLAQIVYALFGYQPKRSLINWVEILERDLIQSLSLHSPLQQFSLFPGGAPVPLLVCGGSHDAIVDPEQIEAWRPWLKPSDRIWLCPEGRHFFQATRPQAVAQEILAFWQAAETPAEAGYLSR